MWGGGGGGELAIYSHISLLGQLTVAANQSNDIETYKCKRNEAKRISCVCDQATREFLGQQKKLIYIVLQRDGME